MFSKKMHNQSTMTVERQHFRILKIQDGGQICTEVSRTQILQSIATAGLIFSTIGAINLFVSLSRITVVMNMFWLTSDRLHIISCRWAYLPKCICTKSKCVLCHSLCAQKLQTNESRRCQSLYFYFFILLFSVCPVGVWVCFCSLLSCLTISKLAYMLFWLTSNMYVYCIKAFVLNKTLINS